MKADNYDSAALKFVEAIRNSGMCISVWDAPKTCGMFANNAGFAFYEERRYEESSAWIHKAIEFDPKRAVAYLNLGDALAELKRNSEAREAYRKYLELAPASKAVPDVKKKLEGLSQ